jgi:GNAT superfamily N-acetyltransferase
MMQGAHRESPRYRRFVFDKEAVEELVAKTIATSTPEGLAVILVCEDSDKRALTGLVSLAAQKHTWCSGTYAIDLVQYVKPSRRGGSTFLRLIDAAEQWAESKKVDEIMFGISSGYKARKNIKLYERLGYKGDIYAAVKSMTV